MTDLHTLRDMMDEATGPSRVIDDAIMALVYVRDDRSIGTMEDDGSGWKPCTDKVWVDPVTDRWVSTAAHAYTSSIDAALALVGRLLPGWWVVTVGEVRMPTRFVSDRPDPMAWVCRLQRHDDGLEQMATAPTAPLAIIKAMVAATTLQAERPVLMEAG